MSETSETGAAVEPDDAAGTDASDAAVAGEVEAGDASAPTGAEAAADDGVLEAGLLPSFGASESDAVQVTVYVVTGYHGLLRVPESFCKECHMFTRRAQQAAEAVDADVNIEVRSWWTRFLGALRYGGYHPPVLIVGGTRVCQGHDVPTTEDVVAAIEDASQR